MGGSELDLIKLVVEASLTVKLVMFLLFLISLTSWTLIFRKWMTLRDAEKAATEFEDRFWSGRELGQLYNQITSGKRKRRGMEAIFEAGFKEFARLRKRDGIDGRAIMEGSQRAMRVALSREMDHVEAHLPFLATAGSTSPYIGLFGTVWGIMNSFSALGNVDQATLSMVAPGIAEALIATAMGLFAAIPAVIAFNKYSNQAERLMNRYDVFLEEFSTILQRQTHA